jgi:hypothetical protein
MFYKITKFKEHDQVKDKVLELIAKSPSEKTGDITRTDWHAGKGHEKEYFRFLYPFLDKYILQTLREIGHTECHIQTYWFQQYEHNSEHPWHTHPLCGWSNVYYVEFPKDGPPIEIKMPFSEKIIIPKIEEGDILTFPSNFFHRSPINNSMKRKTVVTYDLTNLK